MKAGTAILVVGGVAVVGVVAYLALSSKKTTAKPAPRKTSTSGEAIGTLIATLGGALVSQLGHLGGSSSSASSPPAPDSSFGDVRATGANDPFAALDAEL